jgi:hypothetical protein
MGGEVPERSDDAHLSTTLETFARSVEGERVDLGTIIRSMGRRSIGALLLILALPMALPIPAPGASVVFGVPLIVVSAQLLLGRRSAWLPERLARRSMGRGEFTALIGRALPSLRALERIVRPRFRWMAGDWAMVPVGAVCLVLAVIITLPIPLGHMVPGAAISLLALGMVEHDGLVVGVGLLTALLGLAIVAAASTGLLAVLSSWLSP